MLNVCALDFLNLSLLGIINIPKPWNCEERSAAARKSQGVSLVLRLVSLVLKTEIVTTENTLRSSRGICSRLMSTWCKMRRVKVAARGNILAIFEKKKKREKNNTSPKQKFLAIVSCAHYFFESSCLFTVTTVRKINAIKRHRLRIDPRCVVKVLSL